MYPKLILLVLPGLLCWFFSSAQINQHAVFKRCPLKTINFEQGLSNNTTTDVITDALGFTWISTYIGLQRYNGYNLETVNPVVDKQIININSPVYFFALKNGLIWISYKNGVLEYDPRTNSFEKVITAQSAEDINCSVVPLKETDDAIWCLKYKTGLVVYSKKGVLQKKVPGVGADFSNYIFSHNIVLNTTFSANNNSVFLYNGANSIEQLNIYTGKTAFIPALNLISFTCSNTNMYIVSVTGIEDVNLADNRVEKTIALKKITTENLLDGSCFLNDENQLLVSINRHLMQFDAACNFQKEFTDLNHNPVLTVGFIRIIYADKFKRIWLLTNDDIKRIQNFDIPFEHFIYAGDKNNFIRSIYYDEQKKLLLAGCYNGGLQLYDTLGNTLWPSALSLPAVKDINVIEKISASNYLVETIGKGWYVLNLPSKKITALSLGKAVQKKINTYAINFPNNLQRINDTAVIIATQNNVYKCIFKSDVLVNATALLTRLTSASEQINVFFYTDDKTLWAATNYGLVYRSDVAGRVSIFNIPQQYQVRTITEDAGKNVWIGTDKGLYVYKPSGVLFKSFTMQNGLLNDCIYALLPVQNKAAVFASSNLGLSYVSLNERIVNYTKESGLQENEFNTGSAIKTKSGKYYFGGVNGITSFYPSSLFNIKDTPLINITKLIVNDSVYSGYSKVWRNDSVFLSYNQNHIELDFAASGLLNTNEYVYMYRLKSFENTWQNTHEPTGIKYVLQPGKYVFQIACHPIFSLGNSFTKSMYITVFAPWWQSWWFVTLMILSGIILISFVVFQYNRRSYVKQIRALELQQKIQEERQRISRDLHDNLGAYAAAIAANISSAEKNRDTYVFKQLKTNSQAIITQLNDTIWALNKEAVLITAISDRFKVFIQKIKPSYEHINIDINEEVNNDVLFLPVNALHLFRIMQEVANNALRHSNCKNILVQIFSNNNWQIIIKDDGTGMNVDESSKSSGNGLGNIRMRAAEAGWNVNWKSTALAGTEFIIASTTN